jgi:hypothetical protein
MKSASIDRTAARRITTAHGVVVPGIMAPPWTTVGCKPVWWEEREAAKAGERNPLRFDSWFA